MASAVSNSGWANLKNDSSTPKNEERFSAFGYPGGIGDNLLLPPNPTHSATTEDRSNLSEPHRPLPPTPVLPANPVSPALVSPSPNFNVPARAGSDMPKNVKIFYFGLLAQMGSACFREFPERINNSVIKPCDIYEIRSANEEGTVVTRGFFNFTDRCFVDRIFIGQIPKNLRLNRLAWICEQIGMTSICFKACACPNGYLIAFCKSDKVATLIDALHKKVLFDINGAWVARNNDEQKIMMEYCQNQQALRKEIEKNPPQDGVSLSAHFPGLFSNQPLPAWPLTIDRSISQGEERTNGAFKYELS